MSIESSVVCLDANVFLAVLIPEAARAPREEIAGAKRVINALERGDLRAITTAILLGEMRYVFLREGKPGFEIARAAIESAEGLSIVSVTVPLAVHAADLRKRYYSKKNTFSYNDGLYLATAVAEGATRLITTDPHLLNVAEVRSILPSHYH